MAKDEKKQPNEKKPIDSFPFEPKQHSDLPWSIFLGKKNFSINILIFSSYFKRLGVPQTLSHGDWYYVNTGTEDSPNYVISLYTKDMEKEDFTFDDMKFLSSGKYVKILNLQELMTIILMCTYNFCYEGGLVIDPDSVDVTVRLYSNTFNSELCVHGKDLHETLMQAAYECYLLGRNLNGFSLQNAKGLVIPMSEKSLEDDDD